jgi:hypothetical protein
MMDFELSVIQQECKYDREDGLIIVNPVLHPFGDALAKIDKHGIWPKKDLISQFNELRWKPCHELKDKPYFTNPRKTPALPFQFTARELAAFAVGGIGEGLFLCYVDESGNLSQSKLESLGIDTEYAQMAIKEAFDLYQAAESKVGKIDKALQQLDYQMRMKSHDARLSAMDREGVHEHHISDEEYSKRHAKATSSFAQLEKESAEITQRAYIARKAWRKAMVLELLAPKSSKQQDEPTRRLAALKALGGSVTWKGGEPSFKKTNELIAKEKNEGRKRTSPKTIRGDLRIAALAERKAQREGLPPASPMPR